MDQSDFGKSEETLQEIARAQRTLDEVEDKMKKFRSKRKQEPIKTSVKAPYPDLNRYFSFLDEIENNEEIKFTESQSFPQDEQFRTSSKKPVRYESQGLGKENQSMTINQKLQKEKKSSICKLQQYYFQRNEALEERVRQLKQIKDKIVKDQKLLLRNNEELEGEIQAKRNIRQEQPNLAKLQAQVRNMRNNIADLEEESIKMVARKKEIERSVKESLRGHKANLKDDLNRNRSITDGRCKYH